MTQFNKGDKVEVVNLYGGTSDNRVGAKGTITEVRGGGTAYNVQVENEDNARFGHNLVFYPSELKLIDEPKPFTFKDIQKGDTIRRTLTRKSGAKEVREGTVSKVVSWYVEDDSYILAYDTDTADATDVTLELLNRPVPPKKPWEDAERGTVIKRGEDHLVRNAGGWLFIYTNGSKVQRSQKDTEVLLRGEEDLQVTPA